MTKSLIEEVAENQRHRRPCPACKNPLTGQPMGLSDNMRNQMGPGPNGSHKRGRWKGLPRSGMPVCRFCHGLGVVYLNRICQCGYPANLYDSKEKVWYCGDALCAQKAVFRRTPHATTVYPPGDWYGEM